jgi:adenine/guanine phosphoribosyltransferase-like PRPP-binding protein
VIGKSGKMPGVKVSSPSYEMDHYIEKSYIELPIDYINAHDKVVIIDERIFTGYHVNAAAQIITSL